MAAGTVGLFALVVGAFFFFCLLVILIYVLGYKRVPPGKAMVVYGKGFQSPGYMIITAGGRYILPVVQGHNYIPLEKWRCEIPIMGLPSNSDPRKRVDLTLNCQFGIGDDEKNMKKAVNNFLRKNDEEIHEEVEEMVRAHASSITRDMFGKLPLAQLTGDRAATGEMVRKRVDDKVSFMGLKVSSLTIKDLNVLEIN